MRISAMISVNEGSAFRAAPGSGGRWMVVETMPAGTVKGDPDRGLLAGLREEQARGIAAILNGSPPGVTNTISGGAQFAGPVIQAGGDVTGLGLRRGSTTL